MHKISFYFNAKVDLLNMDQSAESRAHAANLLGFFNVVAKNVLREEKYMQVGRFPKFFHAKDLRQVDGV